MIDDIVVGFEDAVRQPVVAHILPDVLDGIEFRGFRREGDDGDIGWNDRNRHQHPTSRARVF